MKPLDDELLKNKNQVIELNTSDSGSTGSLCTTCKRELSWGCEEKSKKDNMESKNDPEDDVLDDLLAASKSLSQISMQDDDFDIDLDSLYNLENLSKSKGSQGSSDELVTFETVQEYSSVLHNNGNSRLSKLKGIHDIGQEDLVDEGSDFCLRMSSLRQNVPSQQSAAVPLQSENLEIDEPPEKRTKFTYQVPDENLTIADEHLDDSGPDYPSETELQKIDDSAPVLKHQNLVHSCQKSQEDIALSEENFDRIIEKFGRKKRHIQDLANRVYEASCYLRKINEALTERSESGSVVISSQRKSIGFDKQFDFPDRRRFPKLPVTIESSAGSRNHDSQDNSFSKPQHNSTSGHGKNKKSTPKNALMNGATLLKPLSIKPMNKRIEIAVPNRFKQQSIKEMLFNTNKENKEPRNRSERQAELPSGDTTKSFSKDSISDSGSMYEYNPLVRARKPTA